MAIFITKDAYFKLDKVKVTKYASIREGKGGSGAGEQEMQLNPAISYPGWYGMV